MLISRLDVDNKDLAILDLYGPIVPEEFRCCLEGKNPFQTPDTKVIAIGIQQEGQPLGIALASYSIYLHLVTLHYFYVESLAKNSVLANELLEHLEKEAKKERLLILTYVYVEETPETVFLEKVLASHQWQGPQPFMIRCLYDGFAFDVPWIVHNDFAFPKHCQEFPWTELTPQERQELKKQESQSVFSASVSPFRDEECLEPMNSLGVRYKGKVVGWMLTHRINSETIRYTAMYVDRSLPQRGRIMAKLLVDSIRLHMKHRTPWALIEIPLLQVSPSWVHFVERRLVPFADKVTHLVQTWKAL